MQVLNKNFKMDLGDVLLAQTQQLQIGQYENELQMMQSVFSVSTDTLKLTKDWLKQLQISIPKHSYDEASKSLRVKGNAALQRKELLTAARYYTDAIIAAKEHKQDLALAHANRAQVLLEFGYYTQAYDDCVCALKYGYPENLKHKVLLRQATCAAKQKQCQLLQVHIEELQELQLNAQNSSKLLHLQQQYLELVNNTKTTISKTETVNKLEIKQSPFGRCLQATLPIAKDEIIFKETAFSCVPVGKHKKCAHCFTTLYIPFPCAACCGNVHYCSLACVEKDARVHKYECAGYRLNLFSHIGIGHLALRTALQGATDLMSLCKTCTTAEEIWQSLFKYTG